MSKNKPAGVTKTLLFASAMATLISTGACNDEQRHVDHQKVQEYAQTIDSVDIYQQKAKEINNGRIESQEDWQALRDIFGQLKTYEQVLHEGNVDIPEKFLERSSFAFNKLDRFRNELIRFKGTLQNTQQNNLNGFRNFSQYYRSLSSLTKEYENIGKVINAFGSHDLVFPLLIRDLSETMALMEAVAPMLADREEQTRELKSARKVASDLYYRLNFLLDHAHKQAF